MVTRLLRGCAWVEWVGYEVETMLENGSETHEIERTLHILRRRCKSDSVPIANCILEHDLSSKVTYKMHMNASTISCHFLQYAQKG